MFSPVKVVEKKVKKTAENAKKSTKVKIIYDKNSCKFNKDGICKSKSSVNYGYECERPSTCIGQKPLPIKDE